MSSLRVIIGRVTAFGVGFLLLLALLDMQLIRNAPTLEELKYRELLHPERPADVVIFGSSITVHGISPNELTPFVDVRCPVGRIYNFGYYGGQPIFHRAWYERLFRESVHHPRVVVIALDWLSLDVNWKRLEQDARFLPLRTFIALWRDAEWSDRSMMVLNRFRVFRAGPDIAHVVFKEDSISRRYFAGYIPLKGRQEQRPEKGRIVRMDGQALSALAVLVDDLHRDNIEVVLVQMPALVAESIQGLPRLRHIYRSLAVSRQVPLIDFTVGASAELFADPHLFSDGLHLNATGSALLTKMLARDLVGALRTGSHGLCQSKYRNPEPQQQITIGKPTQTNKTPSQKGRAD